MLQYGFFLLLLGCFAFTTPKILLASIFRHTNPHRFRIFTSSCPLVVYRSTAFRPLYISPRSDVDRSSVLEKSLCGSCVLLPAPLHSLSYSLLGIWRHTYPWLQLCCTPRDTLCLRIEALEPIFALALATRKLNSYDGRITPKPEHLLDAILRSQQPSLVLLEEPDWYLCLSHLKMYSSGFGSLFNILRHVTVYSSHCVFLYKVVNLTPFNIIRHR